MLKVLLLFFTIVSLCLNASARLIPYSSQQRYVFTNKVSIRELYGGDAEQSSYTLKSLLTINSVWNKGDEQLLQAFFSETFVSTLNKISKEHVEEITKIPDKPFYISLVNGKPQKVIAYTLRDQSLLNIEKGLASLLQIQWEKDTVKEVDVSGECNVFYRYKSSNRIEKIKKDCTNWDLKVNYRSEKPLGAQLSSQQMIEYDLSADGQLISVNSMETHHLSLTAKPNAGSLVESTIEFKHTNARAEGVEQLPYNTLAEAVNSLLEWHRVFDIAADVDGAISEIKDVTLKQLLSSYSKYLADAFIGREQMAGAFTKLLPIARITKENEFVQVLNANEDLHFQLVDLLAAAQTIDAHNAVHKVFQYNKKSDTGILEQYLQSLSVGTHPDRAIVEDLFTRLQSSESAIENVRLRDAMLQAIASLIHQLDLDDDDVLLQEIRLYILNQLDLKECKNDVSCVTRHIRALQNLQDPSILDNLLQYIQHTESTIAVTAMQALKNYRMVYFNEGHYRMLKRIFYQVDKRYDSSVRVMALDILLAMRPTKEDLESILEYLDSNDSQFEIKTYVIQKLQMIGDKCPKFKSLLQLCLKERPNVNNYHVMGQKGLTTVLSRDLSWSSPFNESILSIQEINRGILKRGSVEMTLDADGEEISTFKLGIYTRGLTSFVGDSSTADDSEDDADDSPSTAGMEISVQGVLLRPLVFFTGHTELMGHVWSGTASEPTPAFQATVLAQDHEQYVILASGATVHMRIAGFRSVDLNGMVTFSLWSRNADTEIVHNSGTVIQGFIKAGITYAHISNKFSFSYEPILALQAHLNFYSGIKLCIKLERVDMDLRYLSECSVILNASDKPYTKTTKSKNALKIPGRTFALNQKNNVMCNQIHE